MRQLILIRDIDEEIAVVGSDLARIPEERETIERELVAARETLAQAKELLESEEVEERRLEGKMREQEALLQRLNAQSAQVTSPQAYEALQHELEHAGSGELRVRDSGPGADGVHRPGSRGAGRGGGSAATGRGARHPPSSRSSRCARSD